MFFFYQATREVKFNRQVLITQNILLPFIMVDEIYTFNK